eukprot:gnl/TRDRNA2_/TRDRNA2_157707_c0_seq2.p1 gnl/TRDRNA2_/TRDRNA2_157707_c0~~gnl/TRDRNA2_/TRDRNA2_157707_c0_seq2.p1  ORF type:complete len:106 (-),score=13.82 gnl/TRDRNA2_/TRDRNA2_157707_c0_seq2:29-346(-)
MYTHSLGSCYANCMELNLLVLWRNDAVDDLFIDRAERLRPLPSFVVSDGRSCNSQFSCATSTMVLCTASTMMPTGIAKTVTPTRQQKMHMPDRLEVPESSGSQLP